MIRILFLFILISFSFSERQLQIDAQTITNYYPRIGLALGGGSAKGFYHLGIIKALEENNIKLAAISGSSMGAVVGGIYALGYSSQDILDIISQIDIYNTFSHCLKKDAAFVYKKGWVRFFQKEAIGFSDGKNVEDILQKYTLDYDIFRSFDFNNYPIKLRIVATEFPSGKKVIHQTGPLSKAIMSSISVPFVFRPFHWQNKYYLDGVLSEIVPLSALPKMDILIGINVVQLDLSEKSLSSPSSFALQYFDINVKNIGIKSQELADIMITIPNDQNLTRMDFVKYQEFINEGKRIAEEYLPQIKKLITNYDQKQKILISGIESDRLLIPEYEKETSFSKLVRDIYYLNSKQPFMLQINDHGSEKFIKVFVAEKIIKKIIFKSTKGKDLYKYQLLLAKFIGQDFNLHKEEITKLLINAKISGKIIKPVLNYQDGNLQIELVPVKVQNIELIGNQTVSDIFIKKRLRIKIGQEFNQDLINKSVENLYSTGFFSEVNISYKCSKENADRIDVQIGLIEKPIFSGWAGINYFSSQGYSHLVSGIDYYNNFFGKQLKSELQFFYAKDYLNRVNLNFLLYSNIFNWRFDYRQLYQKLPMYYTYTDLSSVDYQKSQKSIALNYLLFDMFEINFGIENNLVSLSNSKSNNYQNLYLQFSFDNQDQKWLPENGLKADFRFDRFLENFNSSKVSLWYAKSFFKIGTIWLYTQQFFMEHNLLFFRSAPEGFWQPNGLSYNQAFSSNYNYVRISYLRKLFLGIYAEINFDYLRYYLDKNRQSSGSALMFHYSNNLGLLTIGYSSNKSQVNWQLNLSKTF